MPSPYRLSRYIFVGSLTLAVVSGAFLAGVLAHRDKLTPVPQVLEALDYLGEVLAGLGPDDKPNIHRHLQPSRGAGEGVTRNEADANSLVLLVGFFDRENQARLIRRDGTIQARWSLNYFTHFPNEQSRQCKDLRSPLDVDAHGVVLTPEGELVFNYEYCGTVKLGRCGSIDWTISKPTHHSLVRSEAGGYWLLGRDEWVSSDHPERFPPFSAGQLSRTILEDTLLRISDDGEVLEETSIPAILRESGLEALLTATGDKFTREDGGRAELVHANKVAELPSALAGAFPDFEAGDLAISMRELNLVIVVDPVTKSVKWHQTGPWIRQHDPEFRPDGRLSIFNNNVYANAYQKDQTVLGTPFATNIIAVDPSNRRTEVIFGERPGQEMLSVIRGQHELLPDDGILITEFDAGRVLEVNADGQIIWEYVNRYNDDYVGEVTNASVYREDYFDTIPGDAACP